MLYFALLIITCLLALFLSKIGLKFLSTSFEEAEETAGEIEHLLALGAWSQATLALDALEKNEPDHPQTPLWRIRLARETGNTDHALGLANTIARSNPQWLAIQREKGRALLEAGRPREALETLQECQVLLRSDEDQYTLASCHYAVGDHERALSVIASRLRGTDSGTLLALAADCRYVQGSYAEAISFYKRAESKGLASGQLTARMGHCHRQLNQPLEAESCFRTVLQTNPIDISAALNLGICLEKQNRHLDALSIYQEEAIWKQCDPRVMRRAGISAVHIERYRFAETYLQAAHSSGGATADSLAYLGYSIERLRRWIEAEEVYRQLACQHPSQAAGFRGLVWLYGVGLSANIDAQEGLEMGRQLLTLSPEESSWEILAACEARSGNFDQAHQIHESLTQRSQDRTALQRRRKAMRHLRQHLPLDETLVTRGLVA